MTVETSRGLLDLDVSQPIWDRFFWVAPLVIIGTREPDGGHDLAPKHMATPMGWRNYFGFVCTPRHRTYSNAERSGVFTRDLSQAGAADPDQPGGLAALRRR